MDLTSALVLAGLGSTIAALWLLNSQLARRRMGERSEEIGAYRLKPHLGMEATDLRAVNTILSRNAALGAVTQELQGLGREGSTYVAPVNDDETYAKRFHAAYGTTEKTT